MANGSEAVRADTLREINEGVEVVERESVGGIKKRHSFRVDLFAGIEESGIEVRCLPRVFHACVLTTTVDTAGETWMEGAVWKVRNRALDVGESFAEMNDMERVVAEEMRVDFHANIVGELKERRQRRDVVLDGISREVVAGVRERLWWENLSFLSGSGIFAGTIVFASYERADNGTAEDDQAET
ncbi:hypothetical protein MMC09_007081 [Bachmanniomyces sp. S44760]|nr:hypothetical protein [Bachmanniomyces sp. S44760]